MKIYLDKNEFKYLVQLIDIIDKNNYFLLSDVYSQIKEVESYGSGGGFNHVFIHLKNNHIIAYHHETECLEYSYKSWQSISDYYEDIEEKEEGFGYEANNPNHENRIIENINLEDQEEA